MSGDRSTRNVLAAILLVAALFVAMNLIVSAAPLLDWWLPLVLTVVGLAMVFVPRLEWRRGQLEDAAEESQSLALVTTPGEAHIYKVEQPTPRLHTMTIRPDPESAEFAGQAATVAEVLPFEGATAEAATPPRVTPVSPETPAPAAEPQPEAETVPTSPETPTPAAESQPEPMPQSPETPTPDAPATDAPTEEPSVRLASETDTETEVLSEGPSQKLPLERVEDTGKPAADLKFTARTEYADPDQAVAKKEAPPPPLPDASVTATELNEPEKQVVEEKTSAPQQPYEAEQVGTITPEQAERVMDDSTDNAHDANMPVVTETASPRVTAQEVNGEGSVGSADDLVKIDGIGPKISAALKAAGIDSFQKLANTSSETLRSILSAAGVRLVGEVDSWAQQASYAARGDWEGMDNFNAQRKAAAKGKQG